MITSHGTAVSFNNVDIGYLTGFDVEAKAGDTQETTHVESPVVGTGATARVIREYDVTSVEPPTITVTFWGPPTFSVLDAGLKAQIVFDAPGDQISGEAILMNWTHAGRAGQWSTGSATFQLTGTLE